MQETQGMSVQSLVGKIPWRRKWHSNGRKWRGRKSLLMKLKKESKKAGLKLNIRKTKIMASSPIISWKLEGEKVKTVTDFIFWDSKITCEWWLQLRNSNTLAPWKKSYDKFRQCVKKQRHHFADKGMYTPSYDFSSSHVWMWELDHKEGWAPKNWCFQIVVLRVPLTARSNQSVLKEINPEYPLEALMLKLKLQYFGHLIQRADSLE